MGLNVPPDFVPQQARSLLEAAEANKILKALRALGTIKISPNGYGQATVGEDGIIIDMTQLADTLTNLVNNAINNNSNSMQNRVENIEQRLNNASASGSCQGGNISIQFNI